MNKISNWEKIESPTEGGGLKLPAGVYVCKILRVNDDETNESLKIEFDIYEGEYKGFFATKYKADADSKKEKVYWQGYYYQSYAERNAKWLKGFITCITESNEGFVWNWIPQSLVGKVIVFSFGLVETRLKDGSVKMLVKPRFPHSVAAFKEGRVNTPLPRKLAPTTQEFTQPTYEVDDSVFVREEIPVIRTTPYVNKPVELKRDEPKQKVVDIQDDDLPF